MTAFFKEIEPFRGNGNENEKGQTLEEFLEEEIGREPFIDWHWKIKKQSLQFRRS